MLAYTIGLNIWQMWILINVDYIFSSKFLFRYILSVSLPLENRMTHKANYMF
jgi:hypothetical protein